MTLRRPSVLLVVLLTASLLKAQQFTIFPDRKELRSPDGRFVIRSIDHVAGPSEFSGVFRTLVVENAATGSSRGLYNYVGRVAVAWSGNDFVIATDYVSKRTARALVFPMDPPNESIIIDKPYLAQQIPGDLRAHLDANEHVYVEASRIEAGVANAPSVGLRSTRHARLRALVHL